MAERWQRDEPHWRGPGRERLRAWPDEDAYRLAGETVLGRADWGDRESDYEHGFRPLPGRLGFEGPMSMPERERPSTGYAGRGPRSYRRSDERICEDVCDRLTDDPRVDASDMDVEVRDGEVTLSGRVRSREEKRRAEDVAASVSGVRDVMNTLRVDVD